MAWLHTWSGLLMGWLLFVIFLCGTISFWQEEITQWMQPEVTAATDPVTAIDGAMEYLGKTAPGAANWYITPPSARAATTSIFWEPVSNVPGAVTQAVLDGYGNPVKARATKGGYFLYRFHYDLYAVPVIYARYLVGVAAMFMLVALISGIIIHKKIFADFFLLRFGKGQRSWLDAHNVSSVLALPFHLMITYTGLVTLATLYMPWAIAANYGSGEAFYAAAYPSSAIERTSHSAPLRSFREIAANMPGLGTHGTIGSVQVSNPGNAAARIAVTSRGSSDLNTRGEITVFDGVSGKQMGPPGAKGPAVLTESVMIGLHTGRYAGPILRWLYFLSGLIGTAMIATGLILWTTKRRKRLLDPTRPPLGFRIVERLNVAVIVGFPGSVAVYFLANRLLPMGIVHRAEWEIRCLFMAWIGASLFAGFRPASRAWSELLIMTAASFMAVVLVDALTNARWLLPSLYSGNLVFVGFDLTMLATSALFAFTAWKFARRSTHRPPARHRADRRLAA